MCEILLCVKNMGKSGNLLIDSRAPQQGDVVDVHPNNWVWGRCELGEIVAGNPNGNHNFFRIVKLPNVTVNQAANMLTPEVDVDPQNPSPYLQYRARYIDKVKVQSLYPALYAYILDDLRSSPSITLPYTAAQINAVVSVRDPIPFP